MLFWLDVAGAMATMRTNPPVFCGNTSATTLNAFEQMAPVGDCALGPTVMHAVPAAFPLFTVAGLELSLKSKESTTFVSRPLSAPDGST